MISCQELVECREALGLKRSELAAALYMTRNNLYRKEVPTYCVAITKRDIAGLRELLSAAVKAPKKHPRADVDRCRAALEKLPHV